MRKPLFSIITVTFNARDALEVTMNSVRSQTFSDWEQLVVDGGSTDSTPDVARKTDDSRVRVWSEPDKGLYDAMNKGLDRARGEYVIFLNAGDTFHDTDVLSYMATEACKDAPGIIYGQTRLVKGVRERKDVGPRHLTAPRILTRNSFKWGMLVCHQAMAVRHDIAEHYDLSYRFSADYDWVIRCLDRTAGDNRYIDAVIIDYLDEGVTTTNHNASLKERYNIMCRHYGRLGTFWRHVWFFVRNAWRKCTGS